MVGLAHYGPSQYAYGTASAGPITARGKELLRSWTRSGMIQDMSHLTDQSFYESLDLFKGPIFASHSNCRALVPGDRQISDDMIKAMIERDAVIGAVFDAWMLAAELGARGDHKRACTIANVVDHIDHVCQLAGNADHAAIGTDLDGGYGIEQTPHDLDTIVDVQKVRRNPARPGIRRGRRGQGHAWQLDAFPRARPAGGLTISQPGPDTRAEP